MAPESRNFAPGTSLPFVHEMLGALGVPMRRTPMNLASILALIAAFGTWALIWRTRLGYEIRAFGHSEPAAVYAGIDPVRITILVMVLSGALAVRSFLDRSVAWNMLAFQGALIAGLLWRARGKARPFGAPAPVKGDFSASAAFWAFFAAFFAALSSAFFASAAL